MDKINILDELYDIFSQNNNGNTTNASWRKCRAELDILPEESLETITNLIHIYAGDCEKFGFNNGFCYGIQLMLEYMKNTDSSNR